MNRLIGVCIILSLAWPNIGLTKDWQLPEFVERPEAEALVNELLESVDIPSIAVTYVHSGQIAWTVVKGEQSDGVRATHETLYNTASIAKPMVGEIVLRLIKQGKLSLTETMSNTFIDPDLKGNEWHNLLTPQIALSHQTGFKNWRRQSDGVLSFQWKPGTKRGYSGEGIRYVTKFLEVKYELPFETIADNILFKPLGIQNASFVYENFFQGKQAAPFVSGKGWGKPRKIEPGKVEEPLGAGDLYITSQEYAKYLVSLLNVSDKKMNALKHIKLDEVESHCKLQEGCPSSMGFGVGWYVYNYQEHTLLAHSGANSGERSLALVVPSLKFAMVVFVNGDKGKEALYKLTELLYGNRKYIELVS